MKPSEMKSKGAAEPHPELPFPRSEIADPPITFDEARAAAETVCRYHKGIIGQPGGAGDANGTVFLCPVGRQYWRYIKESGGMFRPLNYPRNGVV